MGLKRLRILKKIYNDSLPDNYVPKTNMQADIFYWYHPKFDDSLKGCKNLKADLIEAGLLGQSGTVNYFTRKTSSQLTGYDYDQKTKIKDILFKLTDELKEALRVERVRVYTEMLGLYAFFSSVALFGVVPRILSFGGLGTYLSSVVMLVIMYFAIELSRIAK